ELNEKDAVIIGQDCYYLDRSDLPPEEREKINYDHPDAFDNELLIKHIQALREGREIKRPIYDYKTHTRSKETVTIHPAKIIIIEGIMVLVNPQLRELMDIKIFVDTDPDVRFIRRLTRDINERGRSIDSVIRQYLDVVRLMHLEFVEPSKRYADIIVPEGGFNRVAVDIITAKIKSVINNT
ncbi:MAG: uridine kinase, partial [Candidatus Sumerlaeia bacterium]|nr:uridine kinase [Candidatus Sumerlaeia bacterium]